MSGKTNGIWDGTPIAKPAVNPNVVRILAKDAYSLHQAAAEVRAAALEPGTAGTDAASKALRKADGLEAQSDRLWAEVDKILGGGE